MAPEQPSQDSSPPSNFNPSGVLDQRFAAIDLGDRISRDTSKLIGSGTYGYVYGGTLNPNQTKVAVKSVRFGNKGALPVLKEVLKEVYVWSKLKHETLSNYLGSQLLSTTRYL
ncbi:hypothetical protein J3A83DRAFT_368823 [Scleroderma citrinum]